MKTLLALLLFATPAAAGGYGQLSPQLMGAPQEISTPTAPAATYGFALDDPMTMLWVDAKGHVVIITWDDETRVPKPGGGYDTCWHSEDQTVSCDSGATHHIVDTGKLWSFVWDGVELHRAGN